MAGRTVARTFTIVTTGANALMAELPDRMPVIIEQEDWPTWLGEVRAATAAGEDVLKVWPVSKRANSPRNGAELCWSGWGEGGTMGSDRRHIRWCGRRPPEVCPDSSSQGCRERPTDRNSE